MKYLIVYSIGSEIVAEIGYTDDFETLCLNRHEHYKVHYSTALDTVNMHI